MRRRRNPVAVMAVIASILIVSGGVGTWKRPDLFSMDTAAVVAGAARVIDGDTIEINDRRIRLFGIDAIEGNQQCLDAHGKPWACGREAAKAVRAFIGRSAVSCVVRDHDKFGRDVAVCDVRGLDLNRWIVRSGWAVADERFGSDYVAAEKEAQAARAGIFAGSFTRPSQWRSQHREG